MKQLVNSAVKEYQTGIGRSIMYDRAQFNETVCAGNSVVSAKQSEHVWKSVAVSNIMNKNRFDFYLRRK